MVDTSMLISVVSVAIAVFSFIGNTKRNNTADDRKEATEMTTVIVKLENIGNDTKEIKNELKSLKTEMEDLRERVVVVEQSYKSLHKRLDNFEKRAERLANNE